MSEPTCAACGESVAPDMDHVHVVANRKRMRDRDDREDYYFHFECYQDVAAEWRTPA